ncbi:hypothetical protein D3C72_1620200 [compost metagenome]
MLGRDTGVIDQGIDGAQLTAQTGTGISARLIIRHIGCCPTHRITRFSQQAGLLLDLRCIGIDQGDRCAFLAIQLGDGSANTAACPGD